MPRGWPWFNDGLFSKKSGHTRIVIAIHSRVFQLTQSAWKNYSSLDNLFVTDFVTFVTEYGVTKNNSGKNQRPSTYFCKKDPSQRTGKQEQKNIQRTDGTQTHIIFSAGTLFEREWLAVVLASIQIFLRSRPQPLVEPRLQFWFRAFWNPQKGVDKCLSVSQLAAKRDHTMTHRWKGVLCVQICTKKKQLKMETYLCQNQNLCWIWFESIAHINNLL